MALYVGLMSGSSLDGVDGILAEWERPTAGEAVRERAFVHLDMPSALREKLLSLQASGPDELHRAALAANELAALYARAVQSLLADAGSTRAQVRAVGCHGQTVRHRPGEFDAIGYSTQLMNGALLAERCDIDVVCDFRSRDVAAGGQGAPLVPAFHAETFGRAGQGIAVLNVGGIANLSWLPPTGSVSGFDCGPGNVLMDFWCQRHQGQSFDAGGRWAASGRVDPGLLQSLMREPYFSQLAPKSTGRDLFNAAWLGPHLAGAVRRAEDVMATLLELSVAAACEALRHCGSAPAELLVCGGGAFNDELMRRLSARLEPGTGVYSTARYGVAPDRVEALAFAWLARSFCERRPANLPAVTGAAGPRILGALYPAR